MEVTATKLHPHSQPASVQEASASSAFNAVVDTINPLHHLPVVGYAYRALSEDTIHPLAQLAGGALFGGPLGLAAAAGSVVVESIFSPSQPDESTMLANSPFFATPAYTPAQPDEGQAWQNMQDLLQPKPEMALAAYRALDAAKDYSLGLADSRKSQGHLHAQLNRVALDMKA